MPFSLVLLLGLALPQMAPHAPKPDALALLATARQLLCRMAQRSGRTTYMTISIPNTLRLPNTQRAEALFRTKKHRR